MTSIEHLKVYNKRVKPSEDLVEEHAQFIEMSNALNNLDTSGKNMSSS